MNPQAEELNKIIENENPVVYEMLSEKGKNIFFPKKGILGQTAAAKGKSINATIGAAIEDDGSPMRLKSIEDQLNIEPGMSFPYAPSFGRPDLRQQWQNMIYTKNPGLKDVIISKPVVTNALTHGLSIAAYLFADPGDHIILSDLYWGNYNLIFTQAFGTKFDLFTLFDKEGFNLDSFKEKLLDSPVGKKIVLLNFPNNPTGYTPTIAEISEITEIIYKSAEHGNRLVVMVDDAYFGLVYEKGIETQSIFTMLSELHENVLAIKIDGATKEDYVWGFRTGFITYAMKHGTTALYNALESKTAGAVRGNISNACNLSQSLLLKAFQSPTYQKEKKEKYEILKRRYDKVKTVLENEKFSDYFKALPFNSGYFMCIKLKEGLDSDAIRQILLEKFDTGLISLPGIFRIAFSSVAENKIEQMFENIYEACSEYERND